MIASPISSLQEQREKKSKLSSRHSLSMVFFWQLSLFYTRTINSNLTRSFTAELVLFLVLLLNTNQCSFSYSFSLRLWILFCRLKCAMVDRWSSTVQCEFWIWNPKRTQVQQGHTSTEPHTNINWLWFDSQYDYYWVL